MKKDLFSNSLPESPNTINYSHQRSKSDNWLWIASVILCLVFIIVISRLIAVWGGQPGSKVFLKSAAVSTTATGQPILPFGQDVVEGAVARQDPDFQADQLVFSQIYQAPTTSWPLAILANQGQTPKLPVNVKSEAANYYEIRRRYNLEPLVKKLNEQGSAIVDNPFGQPEQDFFSFYRLAQQDKWPVIITNDVVYYYYQNNLKEVYKALEAGLYDGLWQISLNLFDFANRRYQAAASQAVDGNNPMLEAYRLNAQYWAVTLKLLAPKNGQISGDSLAASATAFQSGDDQIYKLPTLSNNLSQGVEQEVALIQKAEVEGLSPLFGQLFDYKLFKPDASYQSGGRLANFSLASQWLGRPWPIYYRNQDCPSCQLDADDWRLNFLAANILARDLSNNQEVKNYWAKVYKTISYFAGLRDDLTYIHYTKAQQEVLAGQSLEQVMQLDGAARDALLSKLQAAILKNNFSVANGGWDRSQSQVRSNIGLRVLQDRYWPGQKIDWPKVSSTIDVYINQQQAKDWQANQFWSSLSLLKNWLAKTLASDKLWIRPTWWRSQQLALAKFYLINWQLPADQWSMILPDSGLVQNTGAGDVLISIDTNGLPAIEQQIATAKMLRLALAKLQVSNLLSEQRLNETIETLQTIRDLAVKQAEGQAWTKDETVAINNFFQRSLLKAGRKTITEKAGKTEPSQQKIRARLEIRKVNDQLRILVGPVMMP